MISQDKNFRINISVDDINEKDIELLFRCSKEELSISDLSRKMEIAQKNILVRIPKLEKLNYISVVRQGKGKKTLIKTNTSSKEVKELLVLYSFIDLLSSVPKSEAIKIMDELKKPRK